METLDLNDMDKHYIMSDLDDEKVNHSYIGKNKTHPKRKVNDAEIGTLLADNLQPDPKLKPFTIEPNATSPVVADQQSPTDPNQAHRGKSKRRAAGGNINYAIFDKTGCIPKSETQPNANQANEGDDQKSISTDQIVNGSPEQPQGGGLLKKRAHALMNPNDNENDNEFQPPLPKGTIERTSSQKVVSSNGVHKF